MNTQRAEHPGRSTLPLILVAREPESPWAARGLRDLVPPATLAEARVRRDELVTLLGRERAAAADFLLALADFDRRRGWERLGHASLFAFLTRELELSSGAAQLRLSAARLLPLHPAVEAALRDGHLCISSVGQLARVLTPENEAAVLPRFFRRSAREAADVAMALLPQACPPRREVVRRIPATSLESRPELGMTTTPGAPAPCPPPAPRAAEPALSSSTGPARLPVALQLAPAPVARPAPAASTDPLHTCEVPSLPRAPRTPEVEPLTADLRRLHLTVSRGFIEKVAAARTGLSHALPLATTEQVLEAALDLLLERQARRKALVQQPRKKAATTTSTPTTTPSPTSPSNLRRRPHVPAEVEREVRRRDGDRCQHPLDAGGVCGSTWQVELDHVVPLALGGATTVGNLRCACRVHNQAAAREVLGASTMAGRGRRPHPP